MKNKVELFYAVLSGTATSDEKLQFDELISKKEEMTLFSQVKRIWDESEEVKNYREHDAKGAFYTLNKKIQQKNLWRKKIIWVASAGVAAGIILMIGLFTLFTQTQLLRQNSSVVFATEAGNRSFVVLPDSTKVWLNAKTQIRYDADFGLGSRNVYLDGEGYFEVTHSTKPFIVNLSDFKVQVYGTKFNISAYTDDPSISTCLESGKISIKQSDKKELFVEPGQLITYEKESKEFRSANVKPEEYSGWRTDKMYLHNEALGSLAIKLERKYNVKITFEPIQLGQEIHYSGIFDNENISEVLDAIAIASGLRYTKSGNQFVIQYK